MGEGKSRGPSRPSSERLKSQQERELQSIIKHSAAGDEARAEDALHAIVEHGESVLPFLLDQLNAESVDERWWATAALSLIDHPDAQQGLLHSLTDIDVSVRQCSAIGLRKQPSPLAIPLLIEALGDHDRLLARLAADALGALGEEAVSPLTEALRSSNSAVRSEAARALSIMDDPAIIPPLFAALDDPSPLVIHWAEQGLERLGVGMTFFDPGLG